MASYTNSKTNKTLSYNEQFTKIQLSKFSTLIQVPWSQRSRSEKIYIMHLTKF